MIEGAIGGLIAAWIIQGVFNIYEEYFGDDELI